MVFRKLFQCLQQHCIELLEAWNCVRIVFITSMRSVEGMARWTPLIDGVPVRKGGWGAYKRKKRSCKRPF